jgi:peptidyl-prolyl cis-trans isomerase A (cyclophilin A)
MAMNAPGTHAGLRDALCIAATLLAGCDPEPSGPAPAPMPEPPPTYDPSWEVTRDRARRPTPAISLPSSTRASELTTSAPATPSADDPLGGAWSLEQALAGLPSDGELVATIRTDAGEIRCQLWPDRAPLTVANFVGLARGRRPWKTPDGTWQQRPAYDGSTFSRVVAGVLAQGGSPDGTPDGGPGYAIADESSADARHDRAGLLCMASDGRKRGGMQFAITHAPARHLDGRFTIFGLCAPLEVIARIGSVATDRGRPREPMRIESVRIGRH